MLLSGTAVFLSRGVSLQLLVINDQLSSILVYAERSFRAPIPQHSQNDGDAPNPELQRQPHHLESAAAPACGCGPGYRVEAVEVGTPTVEDTCLLRPPPSIFGLSEDGIIRE